MQIYHTINSTISAGIDQEVLCPHPVCFDPEEGKKGESLTGVAIPRLFSITFAKAGPTKSQR